MKIVHFECGLGNQMTCYANYLLVKKYNDDDVYIEDLVYHIDRKGIGFNQWNGFELNRVFGLEFNSILDAAADPDELLENMELEYDKDEGQNNSYSAYRALIRSGLEMRVAGNFQEESREDNLAVRIKHKIRRTVVSPGKNVIANSLRRHIYNIMRHVRKYNTSIYQRRDGNWFYPLSFDVMKDVDSLEPVKEELLSSFSFPDVGDGKNKQMIERIENSNSVSIHARRSDFLQYNNDCYTNGFFKKAVKYIKKRVDNPLFVVFSEDCEWCKENIDVLGLTDDDAVAFVDWNNGDDSYRDMQLMSLCKHNIITKSSFGWWAAYINPNPDKIVVSQVSEYYSKVYI